MGLWRSGGFFISVGCLYSQDLLRNFLYDIAFSMEAILSNSGVFRTCEAKSGQFICIFVKLVFVCLSAVEEQTSGADSLQRCFFYILCWAGVVWVTFKPYYVHFSEGLFLWDALTHSSKHFKAGSGSSLTSVVLNDIRADLFLWNGQYMMNTHLWRCILLSLLSVLKTHLALFYDIWCFNNKCCIHELTEKSTHGSMLLQHLFRAMIQVTQLSANLRLWSEMLLLQKTKWLRLWNFQAYACLWVELISDEVFEDYLYFSELEIMII